MKLTPQLISRPFVVVRFVLSALFSVLISLHVTAQGVITVDTTQTPQSLTSLITGNGVSISNVNVNCKTTNSGKGYGKFTSTVPSLPISEGLILTTGEPRNAIGPNTNGATSAYYGNNSGSAVASDSITTLMYKFSQRTVYEYCMIEFDIVPQGDSIIFDYVFASEEYNEWVNSNYNDVFGFFIQGPGIVGNPGLGNKLNLARVNPVNGTTSVAINSVNNGSNSAYYVSNSNLNNANVGNPAHNIGYDGFTKNLYAKTHVKPCSTYRLQLIIADCGDRIYDSGVFIEKIRSNAVQVSATTQAGVPQMIEGCNSGIVTFSKPTASPNPVTINYWLSGSAINGTDYAQIGSGPAIQARSITFPSGATTVNLSIDPIQDGIDELDDTVVVSLFNVFCPAGSGSLVKLAIHDSIGATISPANPTICDGSAVQLTASGALQYTWSPSYAVSSTYTPSTMASPDYSQYIYVETRVGACKETERTWVHVNPRPDDVTAMTLHPEACIGAATDLIIPNPQPTISYQLRLDANDQNVGNPQSGNDTLYFITNNITTNTAYNILATNPITGCQRELTSVINISVSPTPTALANDLEERSCLVTGNGWITFVAPNSSRAIAAINPNGQNLGWVTIKEFVDPSPINIQACNTNPATQPQFNLAALGRRWVTTPQYQPLNPIDIRFYFDDADFNATKAVANNNANPSDDLSVISDLVLSKYSGPNEDGDFANNCNTGGVTTLHLNAGSGNASNLHGGFISSGRYVMYSIPSCSEMWLHGTSDNNPSPLPVVLDKFSAECNGSNVEISWTTTSEINNDYFSIQKSDDSFMWNEIGTVQGAGNSNSLLNYSFTYSGNRSAVSYYRIVQYDYNGDYEVFPATSLYCENKTEASWTAFPNPNNGNFQVVINADSQTDNGNLQIIDMAGKQVYTKPFNMVGGSANITLDAQGLAHGAYIVKIQGVGFETLAPIKIVVN